MTIDQLPFPKNFGFNNAKKYITKEDTILTDIERPGTLVIPGGVEIELSTQANYGVVVVPKAIAKDQPMVWRY